MRCETCQREFRNTLALGVHQARTPACYDPELIAQRARDREARYRARHPERRRQQVREAVKRLRESSPDYFRAWRKANSDSERERRRRWRRANPDLRREQQRRRRTRRASEATGELPHLFEHLRHGRRLSFWEDELRMDLEQERELAILEGRDPEEAVARYRGREVGWRRITTSFTSSP